MSIFSQEKKREEKKIVLSSSPAEATIVRPSEKEEVIMNTLISFGRSSPSIKHKVDGLVVLSN